MFSSKCLRKGRTNDLQIVTTARPARGIFHCRLPGRFVGIDAPASRSRRREYRSLELQSVADHRSEPVGPFPPENYTGTFGTLGFDIGVTLAQGLAWQVYAPTAGPLNGALAGAYVGPSGEIGVGVGVGANILFGGNGRAYALQPVSLSGEVALNVSVGISTIELRWVP